MKKISSFFALTLSLFIGSPVSAAVYEVTSNACTGTGSIREAVAAANANPGMDTISFRSDVANVKDTTCGLEGADPSLAYIGDVTDDLVIEGNGHSVIGNSTWVTADGGSNISGICPGDENIRATIVSNPVGLLRLEDGVSVEINDLNLLRLRSIAEMQSDTDLTLNRVTARRTFDFLRFCDTSAIYLASGSNQNVTIVDSIFSEAWNDGEVFIGRVDGSQVWNNAFINGTSSAGTLTISGTTFAAFNQIPAIQWDGTVNIESTEIREAGFLNLRGGTGTIANSIIMGKSSGQDLHNRIMASGGSSLTLEASTVALSLLECIGSCPIITGPGAIVATDGASIELKASAVSVGLVDNPDVLIREATGGNVTATSAPNPNWVQPVSAQGATALESILGQPALLTDAPGLPNVLFNRFFFEAVTPLLDDGGGNPGLLIDAVTDANTTNVLVSPIDGSPITEDIFGNPRTEAGGTVRNIGAVQLGLAPTLNLTETGDAVVDLNWTRPTDPGSGAVTGYEVCYGIGTVPDPSALGTDCENGDGTAGTVQAISNAPDTLSGQVAGLTNGDIYWFLVRGINPDPGPWSNAVTGRPLGSIGTPLVTATPGGNAVDLSWTRPDDGGHDLAGYNIFYRLAGTTDWTFSQEVAGGDTLQATVSGLAGGTAYEFGVQAISTDNETGGIGIAAATPLVVPASFRVDKSYTDSNTEPVRVTLSCNTGLPLVQSFTIWPGSPVTFILSEFDPGNVLCEVTEDSGPEAYTPSYDNGSVVSSASCVFDTVVSAGTYTCAITNTADTAGFTIAKHWVVTGENSGEADSDVRVDVACTADILSVDGQPVTDPDGRVSVLVGDGESRDLEIDTVTGSATCTATETVMVSSVESSSEGCIGVTLAAGESATCTFTNTVFYEGIPLLDRYGLAVLALLMLAVGFVGVRRFA